MINKCSNISLRIGAVMSGSCVFIILYISQFQGWLKLGQRNFIDVG